MAGLGAVAVVVAPLIVGLGDGNVEHTFGTLDLGGYLGQVGYLERSSILLDDFHERDVVEIEFAFFGAKFILWEVEGVVD